jgi:type II secretory pathway pseudopilin PulG
MFEINKITKSVAGDTIIEVLMSMAIAGAVIAGAYALASRSLAEGVSASEHSQAIKLAEAQVETLKSRNKDSITHIADIWDVYFDFRGNSPPPDKDNFCLDPTASGMLDNTNNVTPDWKPQYNYGQAAFTGNNLQIGDPTKPNTYNPVCTENRTFPNPKYYINIKLITYQKPSPTYLVTVKWNPEGKGPLSQTQIYYRF